MSRIAHLVPARAWRLLWGVAVLVCLASVALVTTVGADTGIVAVSATNNAKLSVTLDDGSAAFGTNLDPSGAAASGTTDIVTVANSGATGDQGAYYIWKGSGSTGVTVTVKSNKAWDGTVAALDNSGSSTTMTLGSGVLRYYSSAPTDYTGGAGGSAFTTSAAAPTGWTGHAKGTSTHPFYYGLRVDWTDDPGTLISTVTYTITQVP